MRISVIRPDELGPGDIAAWHTMQRSTASLANPFLCPEFAIAVSRVRPAARVAILSDGPSLLGFFPFERRRLGVGVPIAAELTDCQGLIHAPGAEWDARSCSGHAASPSGSSTTWLTASSPSRRTGQR